MIEKIKIIEQPIDTAHKDKETLNFELIVEKKNYYTNLKGFHLCFLVRTRKSSNVTQDLHPNLLPVNNFFAHWIKEVDIITYGSNKSLIPTITPQEV